MWKSIAGVGMTSVGIQNFAMLPELPAGVSLLGWLAALQSAMGAQCKGLWGNQQMCCLFHQQEMSLIEHTLCSNQPGTRGWAIRMHPGSGRERCCICMTRAAACLRASQHSALKRPSCLPSNVVVLRN